MSDKEKHIIYTAKDIEEYLAGNMAPQQMHAIEKAALDDPFLAEAMEGYEAVKDTEWNNHLVALREEIAGKRAVAKVIPLHKSKNNGWKAAAAVLIIGSATTLALLFNNGKQGENTKPQIAQNIPATSDSVIQINIPTQPSSVTQSLNPSASASKEEKKAIPGTIARVEKLSGNAENNIILEPGAPVLKPVAPATAARTADDNVVTTSTSSGNTMPASTPENADIKDVNADKSKAAAKSSDVEAQANRQKTLASASAKKEAVLNNFFTAQVVAADNSPLPFTNISIKKENFGTYADAKGMVRLVSTDSILNIEVMSVGYQPKTFALRNNQAQTKIVLQEEEVALKDRKVVGNISKSNNNQPLRRARLLKDSAVNVEPADGWDNYNTYVANNLDIPETALNDDRHGEVEITFDVKANGTISNIRINKSLGAGYDEAAKRLIQEGPQWKIKKGKKTSASVKVQF